MTTALFLCFGVETLGRKVSLFISAMGMGTLFYIIAAILKIHSPNLENANISAPSLSPASKAMAVMFYVYVCFYSIGWGNEQHLTEIIVHWLIIPVIQALFLGFMSLTSFPPEQDIMALHLQAQLCGFGVRFNNNIYANKQLPTGFIVNKFTPNLYTLLGYKMFLMFATINVGAAVLSL